MKLTLLICISLLTSLLHAAVMPVSDIGSMLGHEKTEMPRQHLADHHNQMMHGSESHTVESPCPDSDYSCCLAVALQPNLLLPATLALIGGAFTPPILSQSKFRPGGLYKPPKFYLFLAA